LFPNNQGTLHTSYHSGISFSLDNRDLRRVGEIMFGYPGPAWNPNRAFCIGGNGHLRAKPLFSLFRHIGCICQEGSEQLQALSLDDQIYRTLTLIMISPEETEKHHAQSMLCDSRRSIFDELIDRIRANLNNAISLTDMQEWSHYSARHLQHLFREKFDCTPMQFVRKQRLHIAMEKLQIGNEADTVTSIARQCGYRFSSNFSNDFQREFGLPPSMVLRASRRP
ncbi:MAG: helix-turn-helix transcriptional regulator, partial [Cyanobacteriota bacterium]